MLTISFQTQLMEIEHEELKAEVEDLKTQKAKLKADLTKESQKLNAKVSRKHSALKPHFHSHLFTVFQKVAMLNSHICKLYF